MPNQNNFRSNVTDRTEPRFTASRIVRFPEEGILLEEVPASFGYDLQDNIEFHFYTIPENTLSVSIVSNILEEIVKEHIVSYQDATFKNYLQIDFTKLLVDKNIIVIPGDYRLVMNFFSDEIGNYFNRNLSFNRISESATEVELFFNNSVDEVSLRENLDTLREFVLKSFNKPDAVGVTEKIFKSGVETNDPTEGLLSVNIIPNVDGAVPGQTFENTIQRIDNIGLREIFETQLNSFLPVLFEKIREEIIIKGDERIQEDEMREFIGNMVLKYITKLQEVLDSRIIVS